MNTTSHLQTICLIENIHTDFSDLLSLVDYLHGDIRWCLLTLQFWLNSGGCAHPTPKDVVFERKHCKSLKQSEENFGGTQSEKDVVSHVKQNCNDNDSEVAVIDTTPRNVINDKGSSLSVDSPSSAIVPNTDAKVDKTSQAIKTLLTPSKGSECTTISARSAPPTHGRCFDSILGPLVCCHGNLLQGSILQVSVSYCTDCLWTPSFTGLNIDSCFDTYEESC